MAAGAASKSWCAIIALRELSDNATSMGADVVGTIGESALRWKKVDKDHQTEEIDGVFVVVDA